MSTHQPAPATLTAIETCRQLLIDGAWASAQDGAMLDVINPATGARIGQIPAGKAADVNRAVAAARRAFDDSAWSRMPGAQRTRLLLKLADLMEQHADTFAQIESLDNGKPVGIARVVDVTMAIDCFRYMAGWATKIDGSTLNAESPLAPVGSLFGFTRREPVGVVGAIIPWNFPLLMAAWKLAPALATGCTVVLKPAEDTSLSALFLGRLIQEAGFPPGVVNIVTGLGSEAGAALAASPGIDKIAFTGSTQTGKAIGRAGLENMTRLGLELGGKSPVIVLADADVEAAAAGAANAIFFNQGQVCTAGSRVYVHRSKFDAVVERIAQIGQAMKLGPGMDPATEMGPLVSARQRQRVQGYIAAGLEEGAQCIGRDASVPDKGFFVRPTVLTGVKQSMRVVREEIFGPVLVAAPFDTLDEAVQLANDTIYGLGASIWSNNLKEVHQLVPRIKAGSVWVNCHTMIDSGMPFGGYKQSGFGRDLGRAAIDQHLETKSVVINLA